MKKIFLILALAFATPFVHTGCQTAPSERVAAVQTLKAVGQAAETAVEVSARLYKDGRITGQQAREIIDVFNLQFQPAYRLAVATAKSDLSTLASPDLIKLAAQLSTLVSIATKPPSL